VEPEDGPLASSASCANKFGDEMASGGVSASADVKDSYIASSGDVFEAETEEQEFEFAMAQHLQSEIKRRRAVSC
jgi:hypothetical protein